MKLANALSWILLLDYRSKPRKVRTKIAGTCSDFEEKVSEMVAVRGHGFAPNQSLEWGHGRQHDYSLFHLILGCSIRHLAVPFGIWLFHLTFGYSIRHLAVPFDIWLFHSTFGCSIWHLAVPFDIWLLHLTFGCSVLHVLLVYLYLTSTIWQILTPFHHGWLDQIVVAYTILTKAKLLVIMLNRSRFVYSVLHTLLSLFASSLDHLTTSYAISSRTARPNHCNLCQFENESYATCYYAESFEVCLFRFTFVA